MKKMVLIPDSFKGSLSSVEICRIVQLVGSEIFPDAQIVSIPVADGGEGTVDAFLSALGGEKIFVSAEGPYLDKLTAAYAVLPDGTAVIEMAATAGLPLVGENRSAEKTGTYGVGTLVRNAIDRGCKKIILGLGGSATNDGGCGCACALGAKFLDAQGKAFVPVGETLGLIAQIDCAGMYTRETEIITMCDIDNPLFGPRGAAHVFAPQKGADAAAVERLDRGLAHLSTLIERDLGLCLADLPGAGAAGGMGAGCVAFLGARLKMGIQTVLDAVDFDRLAAGADLVITGEGRLDAQTLGGKVIAGVADRVKGKSPLVAFVGASGGDCAKIYNRGLTAVFPICRNPMSLEEAMAGARENLERTARDVFRLLDAGQQQG